MTAELLAGVAGIVLSLAFSYIPGLSEKFAGLSKQYKSLIMLGLLVVVAGATFGLSCAKWLDLGIACTQEGALGLLKVLIAAIIANQAVYQLSPETQAVQAAKEARG